MTWFTVLSELHRRALVVLEIRTPAALVEGKETNHAECEQCVEPALVAGDEQWSEDEIMNEEEEQVYSELAPYHEHFLPVEGH